MKEKYLLIVVFGVGVCVAAAARFFHHVRTPVENATPISASAPPPVPEALASALLVPNADRIKQLEAAAIAVKPSDAEAQLLKSPEVNVFEHRLKLAVVAARHHQEIADGESLGLGYLKEMMERPAEAMKAIGELVPKLDPKEFAVDRASLLDVSAQLPGQEAAVRELARSELHEVVPDAKQDPSTAKNQAELNRSLSTDPVSLVPIAAHNALMKASDNADEALADTENAIRGQADSTVRNTLAAQDVNKFPQHESALVQALESLGTSVTFNRRQNPQVVASNDTPKKLDDAAVSQTKAQADQAAKTSSGSSSGAVDPLQQVAPDVNGGQQPGNTP